MYQSLSYFLVWISYTHNMDPSKDKDQKSPISIVTANVDRIGKLFFQFFNHISHEEKYSDTYICHSCAMLWNIPVYCLRFQNSNYAYSAILHHQAIANHKL